MTAIEDKARRALADALYDDGEFGLMKSVMDGSWQPFTDAAIRAMLAFRNAALDEAAKVARGGDTDGIDNFGARRMAQIIAEEIEALKDTPASQVEG